MEVTEAHRKVLRILYAWGLEHFDKYMMRDELIARLGNSKNLNKIVVELKRDELVEVVPPDGRWRAIRIAPKGVRALQSMDVV